MANSFFKFKQFTINQDKTAMKVCTDACLFGAYIEANKAQSILDIGTGTGLLALMLAQKSEAQITAIEIEKNAFEQAIENVHASSWGDKIQVINTDIQSFTAKATQKFDLIISNPPFFQNHLKSDLDSKNLAKHDQTLSFDELALAINQLLSDEGECYILLPEAEADRFESILLQQSIYKTSSLHIRQKTGKNIFRVINKYSRIEPAQITANELFIYKNDREYSDEFKQLLADYYLN